jgi:hypothetical protein
MTIFESIMGKRSEDVRRLQEKAPPQMVDVTPRRRALRGEGR